MPFVPTNRVATKRARPEELFTWEEPGPYLMKATLMNGQILILSEGRPMYFSSPFPLSYEPYSNEYPEVTGWLQKVREDVFKVATEDQIRHLTRHWGERGVGPYVPIENLAIGAMPYLEQPNLLDKSGKPSEMRLIYTFLSPIRNFEPIEDRDSFRRAPR